MLLACTQFSGDAIILSVFIRHWFFGPALSLPILRKADDIHHGMHTICATIYGLQWR